MVLLNLRVLYGRQYNFISVEMLFRTFCLKNSKLYVARNEVEGRPSNFKYSTQFKVVEFFRSSHRSYCMIAKWNRGNKVMGVLQSTPHDRVGTTSL